MNINSPRRDFYYWMSSERGYLKKKLEEFEEHLSKIPQELGIKVTDANFTSMVRNIIAFFS